MHILGEYKLCMDINPVYTEYYTSWIFTRMIMNAIIWKWYTSRWCLYDFQARHCTPIKLIHLHVITHGLWYLPNLKCHQHFLSSNRSHFVHTNVVIFPIACHMDYIIITIFIYYIIILEVKKQLSLRWRKSIAKKFCNILSIVIIIIAWKWRLILIVNIISCA